MRKSNAYVEQITRIAMVPAISDRGQPPPLVFRQAENKVFYALSPQNLYNENVQKDLHGE